MTYRDEIRQTYIRLAALAQAIDCSIASIVVAGGIVPEPTLELKRDVRRLQSCLMAIWLDHSPAA